MAEPVQLPQDPSENLDTRPSIRLEDPSKLYRASFFEAMAEFEAEGNRQVSAEFTQADFPLYVQGLHDLAMGRNLKEGYIPSKEFWIVDEDGYAGRIILGLTYVPTPERVGHHVGYAVRPSKRRKGYATRALEMLLVEARQRGIEKLMPCCDAANVASRKVIERCGGMLLNPAHGKETPGYELRFLIDLAPES